MQLLIIQARFPARFPFAVRSRACVAAPQCPGAHRLRPHRGRAAPTSPTQPLATAFSGTPAYVVSQGPAYGRFGADPRRGRAEDVLAAAISLNVDLGVLNQIEIFFSLIQQKVITPGDFATLLAFTDRYNQTARPFNWKFTAADLRELMARISKHQHQDHSAPAITARRLNPPQDLWRGPLSKKSVKISANAA